MSSKNGASRISRARPLMRRASPRPGTMNAKPTCGLASTLRNPSTRRLPGRSGIAIVESSRTRVKPAGSPLGATSQVPSAAADTVEPSRVPLGRDVTGAIRRRGGDHAERRGGQPLPVNPLQGGPVLGGSAPTWLPEQFAEFGLGHDLDHFCWVRHHVSCSGSSSGGVGALRIRSKCGEGAGTEAGSGCRGTSTGPCWPASSSAGTSLPGWAGSAAETMGSSLAVTWSAGTRAVAVPSAGWASSLVGSSKSGSALRAGSASSACPELAASPVGTDPASLVGTDPAASLACPAPAGSVALASAGRPICSASPEFVAPLSSVTWAVNVARPLNVALAAAGADSLACRAAVVLLGSASVQEVVGRALLAVPLARPPAVVLAAPPAATPAGALPIAPSRALPVAPSGPLPVTPSGPLPVTPSGPLPVVPAVPPALPGTSAERTGSATAAASGSGTRPVPWRGWATGLGWPTGLGWAAG